VRVSTFKYLFFLQLLKHYLHMTCSLQIYNENSRFVEKYKLTKIMFVLVVECYVRDPNFIIVLLIDASQELVNSYGARRVNELCTDTHSSTSDRQPRLDYRDNMLTIMTKFDKFMRGNVNGAEVNRGIQDRLDKYGAAVFVSMILDARSMTDESFESNVQYMKDLPQREKEAVDRWIETINTAANRPPTNYPRFDSPNYRQLIGIGTVREKIRSRWLQVRLWVAFYINLLLKLSFHNEFTNIVYDIESMVLFIS